MHVALCALAIAIVLPSADASAAAYCGFGSTQYNAGTATVTEQFKSRSYLYTSFDSFGTRIYYNHVYSRRTTTWHCVYDMYGGRSCSWLNGPWQTTNRTCSEYLGHSSGSW